MPPDAGRRSAPPSADGGVVDTIVVALGWVGRPVDGSSRTKVGELVQLAVVDELHEQPALWTCRPAAGPGSRRTVPGDRLADHRRQFLALHRGASAIFIP